MKPNGRWELTLITPELAGEWLASMVRNRPPNMHRVHSYAASMRAGDWKLTHQGLGRGDGLTIDAQHRLMAIIESNTSQPFWVYHYFTGQAQAVLHEIDRGLARSDSHMLHIAGRDVSNTDTAAVRIMHFGRRSFIASVHHDSAETLRIFDLHSHQLEWLNTVGFQTKRQGLTQAPVVGAIGRAYELVDQSKLRRFVDVYLSGLSDGPHESAALRLREAAMQARGRGGRDFRLALYTKACVAIKAFIAGTPLKCLRCPDHGEEIL